MQRKSAVINSNGKKYIAYLWRDGECFYKVRGYGDVFGDNFEIVFRSGEVVKGRMKDSEVVGQCALFDEFCLKILMGGEEIARGYSSNYKTTKEETKTADEEIKLADKALQEEKPEPEIKEEPTENSEYSEIPDEKIAEDSESLQSEESENLQSEVEESSKPDEELGFEGEIASVNYFQQVIEGEASVNATEFLKEKNREREKQAFYMELKPQLDKLFDTFPKDEYLSEVIPSSKWVKIEYDNTGKSYSVGVITDGDDVVYIGYGIRSEFTKSPPQSVKSVAQWLPLSFEDVKGEGYWMIYQTASTGENV